MSLGRWMKDYLYIPLGGNKGSKYKMFFNLWIVFVISGLWHGAAWNFVLWGMFHGFFLILDRLFLVKFLSKLGRYISILITYIITLVGWVLFRSETIEQAKTYIIKMFVFNTSESIKLDNHTITMLLLGVLFSFFALIKNTETKQMDFYNGILSKRFYLTASPIIIILLVLSLSYVISSGFNPFIYFRF